MEVQRSRLIFFAGCSCSWTGFRHDETTNGITANCCLSGTEESLRDAGRWWLSEATIRQGHWRWHSSDVAGRTPEKANPDEINGSLVPIPSRNYWFRPMVKLQSTWRQRNIRSQNCWCGTSAHVTAEPGYENIRMNAELVRTRSWHNPPHPRKVYRIDRKIQG